MVVSSLSNYNHYQSRCWPTEHNKYQHQNLQGTPEPTRQSNNSMSRCYKGTISYRGGGKAL